MCAFVFVLTLFTCSLSTHTHIFLCLENISAKSKFLLRLNSISVSILVCLFPSLAYMHTESTCLAFNVSTTATSTYTIKCNIVYFHHEVYVCCVYTDCLCAHDSLFLFKLYKYLYSMCGGVWIRFCLCKRWKVVAATYIYAQSVAHSISLCRVVRYFKVKWQKLLINKTISYQPHTKRASYSIYKRLDAVWGILKVAGKETVVFRFLLSAVTTSVPEWISIHFLFILFHFIHCCFLHFLLTQMIATVCNICVRGVFLHSNINIMLKTFRLWLFPATASNSNHTIILLFYYSALEKIKLKQDECW